MNGKNWSVFVPTSFDDLGRARAKSVGDFLRLFELRAVTGDTFAGLSLSLEIRKLIEDSWFLVPILSRDEKVSADTWRTSEWLIQEVAWASARKKDCLILVEKGVRFTGGILGDVEYLTFNGDSFSEVLTPLGHQVRALLHRNLLTMGIKELPARTHVSDDPLLDECSTAAQQLILELRHLCDQGRYGEAYEIAVMAARLDRNCWRARTSMGALLARFGEVDEGDHLFKQVMKEFSSSPKGMASALHNHAWALEIMGGLVSSAELAEPAGLYEEALRLDGSRVHTRACLILCWLLLGEEEKALRLLEESLLFTGFLGALHFELDTYGPQARQALRVLPERLRNILCKDPQADGTHEPQTSKEEGVRNEIPNRSEGSSPERAHHNGRPRVSRRAGHTTERSSGR